MTYVCVDEPQGFRSSVPPIVAATNPALGMVRLHGRNRAAWAAPGQHGAEQSKYRYSPAELHEWLPKVRELAAATAETHVLFNNCFADNGVSNAGEFARLLGVGVPRPPAPRHLPWPGAASRRNSPGVRYGAAGPNPWHGVAWSRASAHWCCAGHWRELAQRSQGGEHHQDKGQQHHAGGSEQRRPEANAAAERTAEKRTHGNHAKDDDAAGGIHPPQQLGRCNCLAQGDLVDAKQRHATAA